MMNVPPFPNARPVQPAQKRQNLHATPPNHADALAQATASSSPFIRLPVAENSLEHKVVMSLLTPHMQSHHVMRIDRIANPSLQTKFDAKVKELQLLKTRGTAIPKSHGLTESEIFVILGDCLFVPTFIKQQPAKANAQKRNQHDLSFDSIMSRHGHNHQYVIYDGHHPPNVAWKHDAHHIFNNMTDEK
ncbi:hypothetical protein HDU98_000093 [Podochytrium sp. JEL0797]|nr:hypothetical protein HDU98_000093 [Podochytrium sp. JEL0797]